MRILIVSPDVPLPANTGGQIRIWNIIKGLAEENEVHLFALCRQLPDQEIHQQFNRLLASTRLFPQSVECSRVRGLLAMLRLQPFHVGMYQSAVLHTAISQFVVQHMPEIVFVNFIWMTPYLMKWPGTCLVVDQQNFDRQWWYGYLKTTHHPLKKLLVYLNLLLVERFEHHSYPLYNLCFSVCGEDRDLTQPLMAPTGRAIVAPNGVDTKFFTPLPVDVGCQTLAFVGSMDLAANISAVQFFVRDILPIIWQSKPETKFVIIGRHPGKAIRRLAQDPRIEFTNTVDDIRPYLARTTIVVIPHIAAGGTKLKILTAMAMGKAIVATPASIRGIDVEPDRDLIMAENPSDFADQVINLLGDSVLRERLGHNARQLISEQYDWSDIVVRMVEEMRTALQ